MPIARALLVPLLLACGCQDSLGQLALKLSQGDASNNVQYDVSFDFLNGTSTTFTASRTDGACPQLTIVTGRPWQAGDHYSLVASGAASSGLADVDTASLGYSEGCDPRSAKTWWSSGGTFVLDELIGAHADVRFDFVAMSAEPGSTATGTFNITGRGFSETVGAP